MSVDLEKLKWIKENKHVCVSPWIKANLMNSESGPIVQPCCNFKPNNKYDVFSFEPIENAKKIMSQGQLPKGCNLCYLEESKNLQSERMRYLFQYTLEELKKFEQNKELNNFFIGTIFSNFCNLACRSCNEYSSSLWNKIYNVPPAFEDSGKDLTDIPEYWQTLEKLFKEHLVENKNKKIHFIPEGGETMISYGFPKVLEWFIEKGYNKEIDRIIITTNLTVLQNRILKLLDQFNEICFNASIDSVGENYHYVRWPEHFGTIEKNLETISKLIKHNNTPKIFKYRISVTITWSLNNIWYVKEILDFWLKWMIKNQIINLDIECINLYRPSHLVVDILPNPYRKKLIETLEPILNHTIFFKNRNLVLKGYFSHLIDALKDESLINEKEFINYLAKTADSDLRNKVRMKDYNLLYDMLTDEHKNILENGYKVIEPSYDNRDSLLHDLVAQPWHD